MPIKLKAALSARRVQTLNKPGSYADGGWLELIVRDGCRKTWTLRVMVDGKRIVRGLGPYPQVSLADARALAVEYREALLAGRDPSIEAKAEREAEKAMKEAEADIPTFGQMASEVIATRRPVWSNPKHAAQWESTLTTYAFPVMGSKPGGLDHDRRRVGRAEANLDLETRDGYQDQATYGDHF